MKRDLFLTLSASTFAIGAVAPFKAVLADESTDLVQRVSKLRLAKIFQVFIATKPIIKGSRLVNECNFLVWYPNLWPHDKKNLLQSINKPEFVIPTFEASENHLVELDQWYDYFNENKLKLHNFVGSIFVYPELTEMGAIGMCVHYNTHRNWPCLEEISYQS